MKVIRSIAATVSRSTPTSHPGGGRSARRRARVAAWLLAAGAIASFQIADARADVPGARSALASGECGKAGDAINAGLSRSDAEAYFLAGFMYDQGQCVERDAARAVRLYRQAIAQGSPDAAIFLGLLLGLGRGVPQDYVAAHRAFHGEQAAPGDETATAAELTAIGYAETLAKLALRRVDYPMTANSSGIEANVDVVLLPDSGRVEFENVKVGVEVGSNLPRTHDFTDRIESAYRDAMAQAARPQMPADAALRIVTPWHFAMRRTPDNRKIRLEGYVSAGDPRSVH